MSKSMPLLADDVFPQSDDEVKVERKRSEKKEQTKRSRAPASDSEEPSKKRTPTPHHSKKRSPIIKPITPIRVTAQDLFGDDSDGEMSDHPPTDPPALQSVFVNKLASGLSKQVLPDKTGSHYIEIKVYRSDDIEKILPINRWQHSVSSLKIQTDTNSELWQHLANVIKAARKEFRGVPNTFSSNFSMQL